MPVKSNYIMYSPGRVIVHHSACSGVTDFLEIGLSESLSKNCARCTTTAFHFYENTYNAIMLLLQFHIS